MHFHAYSHIHDSPGVNKEDFLLHRVVEVTEENLPHVDALYFLKILAKLESCGRPDVIVDVADAAIKTLVASGNQTNVSTLYSLLFRHHLDAGHIYVSDFFWSDCGVKSRVVAIRLSY